MQENHKNIQNVTKLAKKLRNYDPELKNTTKEIHKTKYNLGTLPYQSFFMVRYGVRGWQHIPTHITT